MTGPHTAPTRFAWPRSRRTTLALVPGCLAGTSRSTGRSCRWLENPRTLRFRPPRSYRGNAHMPVAPRTRFYCDQVKLQQIRALALALDNMPERDRRILRQAVVALGSEHSDDTDIAAARRTII